MSTGERKLRWYLAAPLHAILLVGGAFFVLPLVWMIATSFKPLEQTLRVPGSVAEALAGVGHRAEIDGRVFEVTLERALAPSVDDPYWIVRPREEFPAGEMTHPFGPETWRKYPIFNEDELRRMEAVVTREMKVLADRQNPFDGERGVLRLRSGRELRAELLEKVSSPPAGENFERAR